MRLLEPLFEQNRAWAETVRREDPAFFQSLSAEQKPAYLWIGCSDSRVPANVVVGLSPGEMFVHRNIANLIVHSDLNGLSVVQYAIDVLQVKHVIVCGHYGCGGVQAAMGDRPYGLIDNWLRYLKDVYRRHEAELDALDEAARLDRFCELNVVEQVRNLCHTTIVQQAWARGQELAVHGWIYSLDDGHLHDLDLCLSGPEDLASIYRLEAAALRP